MNEVSSYTIITAHNSTEMVSTVTSKIGEGWVPSGPVVVHDNELLQAMVRFKDR